MAGVTLNEVAKTYGDVVAVDHVNLEVQDGEFVALVGPSGCGKTTVGKALLQLIQPTAGSVKLGGSELVGLKVTGLKRIRIGRVKLGNLPLGQWRYLGEDERF